MIDNKTAKKNIAENVRRLLEDRGMNQSDLARLTQDHVMTISDLMLAKHMSGGGLLARIAEAFDVSIDRIIGPPPKKNLQKTS